MGLTKSSVGLNTLDKHHSSTKSAEKVIALAGNPNVGKSSVFNALTGMNQHTGNWPGKTISNAFGHCKTDKYDYLLVDIPGAYSLDANSAEEEVAIDFLRFESPDAIIVVCDATCLERNLIFALQIMEISKNVIVCLNMIDEAKRKKIEINYDELSKSLGAPVVAVSAKKNQNLNGLMYVLDNVIEKSDGEYFDIPYPEILEKQIKAVSQKISIAENLAINPKWLCLKLLQNDEKTINKISMLQKIDDTQIRQVVQESRKALLLNGMNNENLVDSVAKSTVELAHEICQKSVSYKNKNYCNTDRKIDKIITSKAFGYPIMIIMLAVIFWITIKGANYPSEFLSYVLFKLQDKLTQLFVALKLPDWLHGMLVLGMYRVLAWVVSVMLPPMAIFFPLFTILEDSGILPRIAYNLDKPFKRCCACGKQALTMCMGFGCNAAGVVGCRIIDSPRERLLAILTNNFVPCNGRFSGIIALLSIFFVSNFAFGGTLISAILLTVVILIGICATLVVTKILSKTILKGTPSFFTLELPPYRLPQFGRVIYNSIVDRTIFVLSRAVVVAAPAGIVIWLMAWIKIDGLSLLNICANFVDPFAKIMGLDGVILMAFVLGFPANEIVLPIIIMAYASNSHLQGINNLKEIALILKQNNWTSLTAINTIIFSLIHWPCSTTLITIKKETGSFKWTLLSAIIPTACGVALCIVTNLIYKIFVA